jgi:hypothetical protein
LVLEHIIAHTSLDGVTNQTCVPDHFLYQLISLGVDVYRGVNANDQDGDSTHGTDQLKTQTSIPHDFFSLFLDRVKAVFPCHLLNATG